jgi:hypothetical protein
MIRDAGEIIRQHHRAFFVFDRSVPRSLFTAAAIPSKGHSPKVHLPETFRLLNGTLRPMVDWVWVPHISAPKTRTTSFRIGGISLMLVLLSPFLCDAASANVNCLNNNETETLWPRERQFWRTDAECWDTLRRPQRDAATHALIGPEPNAPLNEAPTVKAKAQEFPLTLSPFLTESSYPWEDQALPDSFESRWNEEVAALRVAPERW